MRGALVFFVVMPILEMWLLITVGSHIGALPTIALVLLTAMVGLALLRQQGLQTLIRARQKMDSGEVPAREMAEGLCLAVGGALLLTPGFLTDAIGFCFLIPGVRSAFLSVFVKFMGARVVYESRGYQSRPDVSSGAGRVFEGEAVHEPEENKKIEK